MTFFYLYLEIELLDSDMLSALEGYVPSSLHDVNLHPPGDIGWESVGGLKGVINTLKETMLWPAKVDIDNIFF